MPKRDLNAQLNNGIVKGQGYKVSTTDLNTSVEEETPAPIVQRDNAKIDRELLKACKLMAVQQDRKLYEVMEEALRYYIESYKKS